MDMTEEQKKQNAHDYTYTNNHNWTWSDSGESRVDISAEISDAYIEGAHSRDEEINELKDRIERQKATISFDDLNEEALRKELNQLRNPWISVEERLPEDNNTVLLWLGGCYKVAIIRDNKWWKCTGWQIGGGWSALDALRTTDVEYLTHWMPIPDV